MSGHYGALNKVTEIIQAWLRLCRHVRGAIAAVLNIGLGLGS